MYLFFDTETTGLPKSWKAPVTDLDNWPRLVQLAWIHTDEKGQVLSSSDRMVKPMGFQIPTASTMVHGISQAQAMAKGLDLIEVLTEFAEQVAACRYLVGHNVSFDEKVVGAELIRSGVKHELWHREKICTQMESTAFCALPGRYGHKWPTLAELHQKLFQEGFDGAHNALVDVEATMRCFFELKKLDVV